MVLFKIWINVYVGDIEMLVIINCISKKLVLFFIYDEFVMLVYYDLY